MTGSVGGDPPAHIRHVGFEGVVDPATLPPGTVANRWPAVAGELDLAAVMCVDNFVAPATWRAHGEMPGRRTIIGPVDRACFRSGRAGHQKEPAAAPSGHLQECSAAGSSRPVGWMVGRWVVAGYQEKLAPLRG